MGLNSEKKIIEKRKNLLKYDIANALKKVKLSNFASAVLINGLFLSLTLIFCDIKYEVSDDFMIAAILSGAYSGTPNPLCMYINPVLSY